MSHKSVSAYLSVLLALVIGLVMLAQQTKKEAVTLETTMDSLAKDLDALNEQWNFLAFWQKWSASSEELPEIWKTFSAAEKEHYVILAIEHVDRRLSTANETITFFAGEFPKHGIGVRLSLAPQFGATGSGIVVSEIFANTPAAKSGICEGDELLSVNGKMLGVAKDGGLYLENARTAIKQSTDVVMLELKSATTGDVYEVRLPLILMGEDFSEWAKKHEDQWVPVKKAIASKLEEIRGTSQNLPVEDYGQLLFTLRDLDVLINKNISELFKEFQGAFPPSASCGSKASS